MLVQVMQASLLAHCHKCLNNFIKTFLHFHSPADYNLLNHPQATLNTLFEIFTQETVSISFMQAVWHFDLFFNHFPVGFIQFEFIKCCNKTGLTDLPLFAIER